MFSAWREFRRGKRQKLETQQFECNLEDNLFQLHEELKKKIYNPRPYTSFYISDPKLRHIHKADIRDRVLHQAVFRVLYPIFDKGFIYDSYSSRLGKGTHAAVDRLEIFLKKVSRNCREPALALKCDISKFFDSIDHNILTGFIQKQISDPDALWLIGKIIKSFEKSPDKGLPLGNVTSQLFASIYLNKLDQFVRRELKIKYYLRYCDDFIILGYKVFSDVIEKLNYFLDKKLSLELHKNKIIIRSYQQGIDFLGYIIRPYHRILRRRTRIRLLRRLTEKNIASYLGVLKHCASYKIREDLTKIIAKNDFLA